jgi:hypothetical protein
MPRDATHNVNPLVGKQPHVTGCRACRRPESQANRVRVSTVAFRRSTGGPTRRGNGSPLSLRTRTISASLKRPKIRPTLGVRSGSRLSTSTPAGQTSSRAHGARGSHPSRDVDALDGSQHGPVQPLAAANHAAACQSDAEPTLSPAAAQLPQVTRCSERSNRHAGAAHGTSRRLALAAAGRPWAWP